MMLETLESRRLMSVSFNSATGLVKVIGSDDFASPDTISASVSGTTLKVVDNGVAYGFPVSKVTKIAVYTRIGGDEVTLAPSVFLPSYIDTGIDLAGGPGDKIQGGSGKDTIIVRCLSAIAKGGAGNDRLENHYAFNILKGEAGNDTLVNKQTDTTESSFDGGTGVDTVDYSMATTKMILRNGSVGNYDPGLLLVYGPGADNVANMENLFAGSGNDYVYGNAANNLLRGGAGKDQLRGGDGNDTLVGGAGEDALFGENGNDIFYTKEGIKDFLSGGAGWDTANRDAIDIVNSVEGSF